MKWIELDQNQGFIRVRFKTNRLDARVADEVRAEVTTSLPREPLQIELDLSPIEFADSMGIGVILHACKLLPETAPRIRLVGCRSELRQVLDLVNLAHLCDFVEA